MTTKIDLEFRATLIPEAKSDYEVQNIQTRIVVDGTRVAEVDDPNSSYSQETIKKLKNYLIKKHPKTPVEVNIKYDKILQNYSALSPMDYHEIMDMVKYYNLFV